MASVNARALIEHVVRFCGFGVRGSIGIDIGADVGKEVRTLAGFGNGGAKAGEGVAVLEEGFVVAGQVVLLQGGGGQEGFAVEEAGELGDEGFALLEEFLDLGFGFGFFFGGFRGDGGGGGEAGVGVEKGVCLVGVLLAAVDMMGVSARK